MSGYFYALLVTSVCGAVCALLAWGGFEKYIKYIASLICVLVMISPFRDIDVSSLTEGITDGMSVPETEYNAALYTTAAEMTEDSAESYISEIVFNKFGIKPMYADIKIDWEREEPMIENIIIALSKDCIGNSDDVKDYLYEVLGGEVIIIEG